MHIKNFYLSFFSHIRFSYTNPGNTRRDGRWKMHRIIPCSDGAPKKNPTIYAVHSRRGDVSQPSCKTQIMIICRLLFFPLGFQSLFSKSIPSPLNYQIYRSFAIDFFFFSSTCRIPVWLIQVVIVSQSINWFWATNLNLHKLMIRLPDFGIIWLISLLLKKRLFKENLHFHQSIFFFQLKKYEMRLRTFFIFTW